MMVIESPRKRRRRGPDGPRSPEKDSTRSEPKRGPTAATTPFLTAQKKAALAGNNAIPSSSPAFATPAYPFKPFEGASRSANLPVFLPILLPPATLRPLAFRTFTKKHSLTLTSAALQELATFIGRHCGSGWREEGLAEKVLEEVAKSWKRRNGGVIVEGGSAELSDVLRGLEVNMSGGRIVRAGLGSRPNSLVLEPTRDTEHSQTRLGLRPRTLARDDSQASMGMSSLAMDEDAEDQHVEDDRIKDARGWLKVVDAYEQPRLVYNVTRKHFEKDTTPASLLPPAAHKTKAFRNRFNVIHQRLLRNEAFQTSTVADLRATPFLRRSLSSAPSMQSHKITPVANLLGRHGSHHMLLGMLVMLPTGKLAIGDLTGSIALDVRHAVAIPHDSAWFAPGMIVLADGVYQEDAEDSAGQGLSGSSGVGGTLGGRFQVFFMGHPPCEKRSATLGVSGPDGGPDHTIGGGFGWIDFLGIGSERAVGFRMRRLEQRLMPPPTSHDGGTNHTFPHRCRAIILGELNLDNPSTIQALRAVLTNYASEPEGRTPMNFVLTGNFTTHAIMARGDAGGSVEYKEAFDGLAAALGDFPTLLSSATWVFVPGDNDAWGSAFGGGAAVPLPRKGVPEMFVSRVRKAVQGANAAEDGSGEVVWTTNPTRVTVFGPRYEMVVFRDDMSGRLRRSAVRLKGETVGDDDDGDDDDDDDVTMAGADPDANRIGMDIGTERARSGDLHNARKLVKTVLDQGFLAPFRQTQRPVHWDYAGALYLYPLPTAVVLVDPDAPAFCLTYEGCHVMNPGPLIVGVGRKGVARWVEYAFGTGGVVRECLF